MTAKVNGKKRARSETADQKPVKKQKKQKEQKATTPSKSLEDLDSDLLKYMNA